MSLYNKLLESSKNNNFSLYYFNEKLEIKNFVADVNKVANFLNSLNYNIQDNFIIYTPNMIQSFAFFYALNKLGIIANIIHPLTPLNTLKEIIINTKPKGIILLDILSNNIIKHLLPYNLDIIISKNSDYIKGFKKPFFKLYERIKIKNNIDNKKIYHYSEISKSNFKDSPLINNENLIATYIHSGGTTDKSKTIKLSNKALNIISDEVIKITPKGPNTFSISVLPIFHTYGIIASMHALLLQQYNLIIIPKFKPKKINALIKKFNVELLTTVPLMIKKLMAEKNFKGKHLSKLKTVYCGGDTVSIELQNKFNKIMEKYNSNNKLLPGYGLTETSSVISVNTMKHYKFGSVGKILNNVTCEIWDNNNNPLPKNTTGEIVITGDNIMEGYLNSTTSGITTKNNVNYIKTGDIGYIDEDNFLFFKDRSKRVIKIAAYNIYPNEIEEKIMKLSFIENVCVIDKLKENKTIIVAIIKLKENVNKNIDYKKMIIDYCKENLVRYSLPKQIIFINHFPLTALGKPNLKEIKSLLIHK